MTTFAEISQACAVCGTMSEHQVTMSSNGWGEDLDGRPGGMVRHSGWGMPLRCPECGYCSPNLEFEAEGLAELVRSAAYQAILADESLPERARECLCTGEVAHLIGSLEQAYEFRMYAAWACDDAGAPEEAVRCRRATLEAIAAIEQTDGWREAPVEKAAEFTVVKVDLLRRVREFDEATRVCRQILEPGVLLEMNPDRRVAEYELVLIAAEDDAAHSRGEIGPEFEHPSIML